MSYPNSNELITLAEVKSLNNISISTYDTFISAQIPTISRAIESYCRRRFCLNTWTQWCSMDQELITDNWPINNVLMLCVPYAAVLITDANNLYNFSIVQPTSNNITIDPKFIATNTQTLVSTEFLFSTYLTLGALKTAVEGSLSGVTFAYQSYGIPIVFSTVNTLCLRPTSGKTIYAGINYFDQSNSTSLGDIYRISENSDRIILNPNYVSTSHMLYTGNYWGPYTSGYNNIDSSAAFDYYQETDMLVVYSSGYTTANVPQELKWAVASIINDLMSLYDVQSSGVSKNIYLKENLGDYGYTLANNANIPEILNRYASQLDYWKRKVI